MDTNIPVRPTAGLNNTGTATGTNENPSGGAPNPSVLQSPGTGAKASGNATSRPFATTTPGNNTAGNTLPNNNARASASWKLEAPPTFHCPKLMVKINEILAENERLLTEKEIMDLDTHECRELARRLSYFGRVRFQGIRTISSSGSKVDMQRRIATWHFCYNRQLHGLHPVPENYEPPPASALDLANPGGGGDGGAAMSASKIGRPRKRSKQEAEDDDDDDIVWLGDTASRKVKRSYPLLVDPANAQEATSEKLQQLSQAESINQMRRQAIPDTLGVLQQLYTTRREIYKELDALDAIVESDVRLPYEKERAKARRLAEETSLRSINEQIENVEANAIVATRRRPL